MTTIDPIYIGTDAVQKLIQYGQDQKLCRFALVADANTYRALGERLEHALKAEDFEVTSIVLKGAEIIADERYIVQTLLQAPLGDCVFLGVGSGTITDITRFVSHRSGRQFVSLPTAPSVDGFTSIGAPLVMDGVKQTINCQAPIALFADLETLCNAPQALIAAGYGDMIGKLTSLADWRLGALLWDEPYDQAIDQRVQETVNNCLQNTRAIGQRSPEGVRLLIESLIESGLCMLEIGNSRPASGAEHHASHYWEMKLLQQHRPAILHGAKVGVALTLIAAQYAKIRALNRQEMLDQLEGANLPEYDQEMAIITAGYGELAATVAQEHRAFLEMSPEKFEQIKRRIAEHWDEIQAIAASVPPPDEIRGYLQAAGAPTTPAALGLSEDEIQPGLQYGHYLRNRFTVMKLSRMLGVPL